MGSLTRAHWVWLQAGLFTCLGLLALIINLNVYHYPILHYVPEASIFTTCLFLSFISIGLSLYFDGQIYVSRFLLECVLGILFFNLLFWGVEKAQLTPFVPIDPLLMSWDQFFHVNVNDIVNAMHHWPVVNAGLKGVYEGLVLEMVLLPMIMMATRKYALLYEYYHLMLISATIGYVIYYFFPTTAPASVFDSPYFTAEQHATGIKFQELHHYLLPSTQAGGLIAFPSFHVIWAWFLVYMVRCWQNFFKVLSIINLCLVASCILLGWHYWVDILGSIGVIILTHWIDRHIKYE